MTDPWVLCVVAEIRAGHEAEFLGLVGAVIDQMKGEDSFINTFLSQDRSDPGRFFLYETWADREEFIAVQMHRTYRHAYQERLTVIARSDVTYSEWTQLRADVRPVAEVRS